mmetsp:Transcript_10684/g.26173  ORF Transcript_10684/g.26173 Transcript_10684/m.26173 type:complete len:320 (-) Transcript_10684:188-1147(-)|eukprot:CAMPEP_0114518150 /NCGR_PEP_ID=MMETSP0109-20121206/18285_1 /TAXON_ID=29199 /ORGANISM="Chlorarachnion reptans, Strain CCCM449" /LENGTH=319 /DNA_ID=CAMNT_0001698741 /DNA_START=166 /DNA_END=1125 /DNA_ORIENTATION=+
MANNLNELVREAERHVFDSDFKRASSILEQVLRQDPKHLYALDIYAKGAAESGNPVLAVQIIKRAISIEPKIPHRWMELGQIQNGHTALKCYRQGLSLMQEKINAMKVASDTSGIKAVRMDMASAFASVAELFVTDLCDEDGAERECENALKCALDACEENAEAQYGAANLRLIQGRKQEAFPHLKKCIDIIHADSDTKNRKDVDYPYDLRLNVSQMAIEMEQYESALEILETLLEEDDTIPNVWYSAALSAHGMADFEMAAKYLKNTEERLKKDPNPDLQSACSELKARLETQGNNLKTGEQMPQESANDDQVMMQED